MDVAGPTATFYVNGKQVLSVDKLFGGADLSGGIGLFTEPETDAYFRNLKVTYP